MSHIRKQKPYGSKMEKFDVVGRSHGTRNLPINIFIYFYKPRIFKNKVVIYEVSYLKGL